MDEPNWAVVLQKMYQEDPPPHPIETASDRGDFTIKWLAENTGLNEEKVEKATNKLDDWDLVEKWEMGLEGWESGDIVEMQKDGFEVAHERELSRRNNRLNYSLVFFTAILVIAQTIGVIPADDSIKFASGVLVLGGVLVIIYFTDMLER